MSPTLTVRTGALEMTPLEGRRFAKEYALEDAALGVSVTAEEGTRACGSVARGCAWCKTHDKDNHHERDASRLTLGISLERIVPLSPGIGEHPERSLLMELSAPQFTALISHLTTVRDRMVADGTLTPEVGILPASGR